MVPGFTRQALGESEATRVHHLRVPVPTWSQYVQAQGPCSGNACLNRQTQSSMRSIVAGASWYNNKSMDGLSEDLACPPPSKHASISSILGGVVSISPHRALVVLAITVSVSFSSLPLHLASVVAPHFLVYFYISSSPAFSFPCSSNQTLDHTAYKPLGKKPFIIVDSQLHWRPFIDLESFSCSGVALSAVGLARLLLCCF